MIELHIKSNTENKEALEDFSNKLHNALRGWKPYIDSEVLLNVDNEEETLFLIGPDIERHGKAYRIKAEIDISNIDYVDMEISQKDSNN